MGLYPLDGILAPGQSECIQSVQGYRRFRRSLMVFFHSKGSEIPADQADEVVYRILKNLAEGVRIEDVEAYARRVAQNVLSEHWRAKRIAANLVPLAVLRATPDADHNLEACLDRCKDRLAPDERRLIEGYYCCEKRDKIRNRERLAQDLGISVYALRIRAHRIRGKLAACLQSCRSH